MPNVPFHRLPLLVVLFVAASFGSARADDLAEVMRLQSSGQSAAAVEFAQRHMAQQPRDATMRFQLGVMLADSGRKAEAIEAFTQLSQDHPDLPEPYNNLAAVHASMGDYVQARAALERALRSRPDYAAAHENLGDVYLALARRAYARAAELEPANTTLAPKLALLRQWPGPPAPLPLR